MKFEIQKAPIDLTDTSFDSIFITDFMPAAEGIYVKVYLLGYKYAKDRNMIFDNNTIANILNVPIEKVDESWRYWENIGVIHFKASTNDILHYSIEFVNLKQLYIDNIYSSSSQAKNIIKKADTPTNEANINPVDEYDDLLDDPISEDDFKIFSKVTNKRSDMFDYIESQIGKILTTREQTKILSIMSRFNYDEAMLITLLNYSLMINKNSPLYTMEKQAKILYEKGVRDMNSLEKTIDIETNYRDIYYKIQKYLRIPNKLDVGKTSIIDKWIFEFNFSEDVIFKCLGKSVNTNNPNFKFFDSILSSWHEKELKTIDDIEEFENNYQTNAAKKYKKDTYKKKENYNYKSAKNKFHNFEGSLDNLSNEDLISISRKKLENKLKKYDIPDHFGEDEDE